MFTPVVTIPEMSKNFPEAVSVKLFNSVHVIFVPV